MHFCICQFLSPIHSKWYRPAGGISWCNVCSALPNAPTEASPRLTNALPRMLFGITVCAQLLEVGTAMSHDAKGDRQAHVSPCSPPPLHMGRLSSDEDSYCAVGLGCEEYSAAPSTHLKSRQQQRPLILSVDRSTEQIHNMPPLLPKRCSLSHSYSGITISSHVSRPGASIRQKHCACVALSGGAMGMCPQHPAEHDVSIFLPCATGAHFFRYLPPTAPTPPPTPSRPLATT